MGQKSQDREHRTKRKPPITPKCADEDRSLVRVNPRSSAVEKASQKKFTLRIDT
jgi:hypothetical protein